MYRPRRDFCVWDKLCIIGLHVKSFTAGGSFALHTFIRDMFKYRRSLLFIKRRSDTVEFTVTLATRSRDTYYDTVTHYLQRVSDAKIAWHTISHWPALQAGTATCQPLAFRYATRFTREKNAADNQMWVVNRQHLHSIHFIAGKFSGSQQELQGGYQN